MSKLWMEKLKLETHGMTYTNSIAYLLMKYIKSIYKSDKVEVVVAGGCIRDQFYDLPVTDIDIFIRINSPQVFSMSALSERLDLGPFIDRTAEPSMSYIGMNKLLAVHEFNQPFSIPFQLIYHQSSVEDLIDEFPVSCSKCWMDIGGKVHYHPSFSLCNRYGIMLIDNDIRPSYANKMIDKMKGILKPVHEPTRTPYTVQ